MRKINIYLLLVSTLLSTMTSFGAEYAAQHCEIFVDKIEARYSGHGNFKINFLVKTINERFGEAKIIEVGVLDILTHEKHPLELLGGDNYWRFEMYKPYQSSNYGTISFYVTTSDGDTFWFPGDYQNINVTQDMYDLVEKIGSQYWGATSIQTQVPLVQSSELLSILNPAACY